MTAISHTSSASMFSSLASLRRLALTLERREGTGWVVPRAASTAAKGGGLVSDVKRRSDATLWEVTMAVFATP